MDGVPASVNVTAIHDIFAGGGEMGELMRTLDWSQTPLGPIEQWPQSLRTAISICLASRFPMLIWWGPELVMLYNDAYRVILGANKHPQAMGQRGRECWPEIWEIIGPMLEGVLTQGEATWSNNQMLPLDRNGYVEECYFTFSYSPIRDETGGIGGVFTAVTETTGQVLGARRLHTLHELADRSSEAQSAEEVCSIAAETLAENVADIPFALVYLLQQQGIKVTQAIQVGRFGLTPNAEYCPFVVDIAQPDECPGLWSMAQVIRTGETAFVPTLPEQLNFSAAQMHDIPPQSALVLPMSRAGQSIPYGLLIAGISPLRDLDNDYRNFFGLVAGQIANAIAKVRIYQEAKERAEALAELDRAKTTFFSNVSHEFRTPLTLLLGPVEDILADSEHPLPLYQRERLEIVRRNGLRLLKLVNTLLDFSRIEASRLQAVYEPTDLAAFTAELASVFRSVVEQAGMQLVIDCPPLPEPVYIDRDMWEKIVLNLLSNAFKFTFSGQIAVTLRALHPSPTTAATVELVVSDTGIGIATEELLHLFERFHQVKGVRARTHEGSGIGLALVNELVHFHGGTVRVDSAVDEGTMFTVSIPLGSAHLPPDRIRETQPDLAPVIQHASPYIEETARWLPTEANEQHGHEADISTPQALHHREIGEPEPVGASASHILFADDNADMRDYVTRLLSKYWSVEVVADGKAALAAIQKQKPDLVLSDVMMPGLDGFQLLAALRANPETNDIPVVLLSARAGEESAVEGLEAGADDYLIKPFSARELLARVGTHLQIAHMRQQTTHHEREHADRLQKLAQASLIIMSTNSLEERLLLITDQARAVIGAHQAITTRTVNSQKQQDINAISLSEKYAQWRDYDTQPDGSGIYSLVCETNKPMRLTQEELEQHPAWHGFGKEAANHPPMHGWLAVPLIGRNGQNLGVIQLSDKYEGEFTEEDEAILIQFAQMASVAIENAELYHSAQAAIRGRDDMLSLVTHDLKNPISTIKGYAQLLKRQVMKASELDKGQLVDGLTKIDATSTKMVTLINELLNVTRLQTGQPIELDREPADLVELTHRTTAEYQQTTEKHTLHVETSAQKIIGEWDAAQLERVLGNLLSNAIKYSPDGGDIIVNVGIEANESGNDHIAVLVVHDSGIGIPLADIPHIFEQFRRAGNATGQFSGTGLGLASAHQIVEQHGGTLTVESAEGDGSVFTVRLPLAVE
jgi:signal transduction histidine kinase/DNA-binding response OmpR family regulator